MRTRVLAGTVVVLAVLVGAGWVTMESEGPDPAAGSIFEPSDHLTLGPNFEPSGDRLALGPNFEPSGHRLA